MASTTTLVAAALAIVTSLGLVACSGDDTPSPEGAATSDQPAATDTATAVVPGPEPVMLGSRRFVSACQALPPQEGADLFRPGAEIDYIDQVLIDDSIESGPKVRKAFDNLVGSVQSLCHVVIDGPPGPESTFLDVTVDNFPDEASARAAYQHVLDLESRKLSREMTSRLGSGLVTQEDIDDMIALEIKRGGRRIPGLEHEVLYADGTQDFFAVSDEVFVTVRHGQPLDLSTMELAPGPKRPRPAVLAQTNAAFDTIIEHAEATGTPQGVVLVDPDVAGPEAMSIDPCALIDSATFSVLTGRHADPGVEVTVDPGEARTAARDRQFELAATSSCRRKVDFDVPGATVAGVFSQVTVTVKSAASAREAGALLDSWLLGQLTDNREMRQVEFGQMVATGLVTPLSDPLASQAYIFDSKEFNPTTWERNLFFARGSLVVSVKAEREHDFYSGGGLFDFTRVPAAAYERAFDLMVGTLDKTVPAS